MSDCGLVTMETWEELNPDEKQELGSVFSGHLHDLVVCALPPTFMLLSVYNTETKGWSGSSSSSTTHAIDHQAISSEYFTPSFFSELLSSQR